MIIKSALDWAIRHNIRPEVIARAYNEPEYTYSDPTHPTNIRRVCGEHCLVIDKSGVILSILRRDQAELPIEETEMIRLPKARGGKRGNIYPITLNDLIYAVKIMGYTVRTTGSGHKGVYEKDSNKLIYTLPSSESDFRSLQNAMTGLRRAGIDVRRMH